MHEQSRFHLSLNARNLKRSTSFYQVLFGMEPCKCHEDYVKFDVVDPPVVFSLVPQPSLQGGALRHLGLRLPEADAVDALRRRLEGARLAMQLLDAASGFRVCDPDGNIWTISREGQLAEFVEQEGADAGTAPSVPEDKQDQPAGAAVVWEHYVTQRAQTIGHADCTVDEARLTGTFNAALDDQERRALVNEAFRVLRPGCKVVVHCLAADKPFMGGQPALPGLAAMVARVPVHTEVLQSLHEARFLGLQFVKYSDKPWFEHNGVGLREVKIVGWKPANVATAPGCQLIYRGPFTQAVDDAGTIFPRGKRVGVPREIWLMMKMSPAADQFLFLEPVA